MRLLRERAGSRQEDIAMVARRWGFDWTRATVAAVETGRRDVTLGEALALPPILSSALGLAVELSDLLPGDKERVALGGEATASVRQLRRILRGEGSKIPMASLVTTAGGAVVPDDPFWTDPARVAWRRRVISDLRRQAERAAGDAEAKAAARLGVEVSFVALAARRLWRRGFAEERDRRLAQSAPHQASAKTIRALRGHISRRLIEELRPEIEAAMAAEGGG